MMDATQLDTPRCTDDYLWPTPWRSRSALPRPVVTGDLVSVSNAIMMADGSIRTIEQMGQGDSAMDRT
jgi:hypothetical protein